MSITHEAILKRRDIFDVNPNLIKIETGWNPRKNLGNMDELMASIIANGVIEPITVRNVNGDLFLVDGERRLKATLAAISTGNDIKTIPATIARRGISDTEAMLLAIAKNDGKPFLPSEEAAAYQRLKVWGVTVKEIAQRVGKSEPHVYNRLKLVDAAPEVREAVDTKSIGVTDARKIVMESGGDIEKQKEKLAKSKDRKENAAPKCMCRKDVMETMENVHAINPTNPETLKLLIGVKVGLWMVLNDEDDYHDAMNSMKKDGWIKG
jgi:ParB/RepB/Spo0J family partition protein